MPRAMLKPPIKTPRTEQIKYIMYLNDPHISETLKLRYINKQSLKWRFKTFRRGQAKRAASKSKGAVMTIDGLPHSYYKYRYRGNTSKYRGVSFDRFGNSFKVCIALDLNSRGCRVSLKTRKKYIGSFPVGIKPGRPGYEKAKERAEYRAAMAYDKAAMYRLGYEAVISGVCNFKDWTFEECQKFEDQRKFDERAAHAQKTNAGVLAEKAAKARAEEGERKIREAMLNGKAITQDSPPPELMDENQIPPVPRPIELIELFIRPIPKPFKPDR